MKILETERLILRHVEKSDGEFMLDLLNQPSFIKYIGDRNVRTVEQAEEFIETRYQKSYEDNGYGLYLVELKPTVHSPQSAIKAIGICGFVKRDNLPNSDIGFAFLPEFEGKGYAFESAEAVLKWGEKALNLRRVLAITIINNKSSIRLLEKLGFKFEQIIEMASGEKLNLFSFDIT